MKRSLRLSLSVAGGGGGWIGNGGGKRKGKDYFGLSWEKEDDHEAVYSTRPLGTNYVATKVSGTLPGDCRVNGRPECLRHK